MQEHPLLLRYAECGRRGHAGHHHAGCQVDLQVGAHQLRVRVRDGPVGRRHRRDLLGRPRRRVPRVGVLGRDRAVPRPQVRDGPPVLGLVGAGGTPQRGLDQRVDVDRRTQPHAGLRLVVGRPVDADHAVRGGVVGLPGPLRLAALRLQRRDRRPGLRAAHQHHVRVAAHDPVGGVVHGQLSAVTAVRRGLHGRRLLGTHERGDQAGLVGVGPRGARHGVHQVGATQHVHARVAFRGAQRLHGGGHRLHGSIEVGRAPHDLADPDHHRRARLQQRPRPLVQHRLVGHPQPGTTLGVPEQLGHPRQRVGQRNLHAAHGGQPHRPLDRRAVQRPVEPYAAARGRRHDARPQPDRDAHRARAPQLEPVRVDPRHAPPRLRGDVHQRDLLGELRTRLHPARPLAAPRAVQGQPLVHPVQVGQQLHDLRGGCRHRAGRVDPAGVVGRALGLGDRHPGIGHGPIGAGPEPGRHVAGHHLRGLRQHGGQRGDGAEHPGATRGGHGRHRRGRWVRGSRGLAARRWRSSHLDQRWARCGAHTPPGIGS